MDYRILFTLYGSVFGTMLLITLLMKKRKKNVRTKLYTSVIILSTIYAVLDLLVYYLLSTLGNKSEILRIIWNARSTCIYVFMMFYGWYIYAVYKDLQYEKLGEFLKKKWNIAFIIYISLASAASMIMGGFPDMTIETLAYTGGRGFLTTMVFPAALIFFALLKGIKYFKTRRNVFNTVLFMFISLIVAIAVQILIPNISFLPFITIIINFIIYYNIENPDIDILTNVTDLKQKIDKSSNAKTDFLFNLSYDLINPMNAIVSLSQSLVILSIDNKEEIVRDLKSIKYAGNTLLDSIDNVLDLSESDEQDNKVNLKEYSLFELLKRVETVALTRIGAKQIAFELNVDENLSSKYQGDITKLQKVLLNVINNAAKFTDIGKIKLSVSSLVEKDKYMLQFKISDTGCGIKDEEKSFVFSNQESKSSVGLAISKKYVDVMNGTITFDSVYGAGTTFIITVPQNPIGTKKINEDQEEYSKNDVIEYIDLSNYKALIVDDDELDIKVTSRLIEKYKLQITVITSSLECIDRIKQEEQYDILFLDHKMPELDGMETMKVLKGLEGYKIPKIVALTANAVAGAKEYYLKEGFDDYLSKPIDIHKLDKIITRTFQNKQ